MDLEPQFKRDILVSIRPFYATKILNGQKRVGLRRKFPPAGSLTMRGTSTKMERGRRAASFQRSRWPRGRSTGGWPRACWPSRTIGWTPIRGC